MNYKNNLSLILASTMVSGMFSAAVSATAYKFNNTTGNLAVHKVTSKNVIELEDSDSISLALSASETPSQKFAFSVNDDVVNENAAKATDNKTAADAATIKDLKKDAEDATKALTDAAKAAYPIAGGAVASAAPYAKAFRKAVVAMAKINGTMADKSNAKELTANVKDLILAYSAAMKKVHEAQNAVVANEINANFTANALPEGAEEAAGVTSQDRLAMAIGSGAANDGAYVGLTVGENVTGIADNLKYEIVGARIDSTIDVDANPILPGAAIAITDNMLNNPSAGAATGDLAAFVGAVGGDSTFIRLRKSANTAQALAANDGYLLAAKTSLVQLTDFATWAQGWFYKRAKTFLTAAEAIPAGATNASWLGAGAVKSLNSASDYTVTVALKKGSDAVAVRKITDSKVTLGGENGATVTPLVVEFVPKTATKDTTIDGTLKITSAGKTQEVAIAGTVSKSDAADVDPSAEQTVVSGYKYTKENTKAIRDNGGDDEFVLNVLAANNQIAEPVTITLAKAKTMKTGAQTITATVSEDENANALYAEEDKDGKKKNDVAIFSTGSISTGKVEYSIPVEVLKEELGELENGAKVYVYLTSAEKLEATKEKKAAAKKAEAKASANDGAVDSTRMMEGKVVDGRAVFAEDPSKITREDGEVFMISKNKLDIKDAEEASAEEDKEEEDEEEAEDEEEEEDKAEEEKAEGEEAATEGAAGAATAGNDALTTEGTVVDEVTANEVPASTEEVSANAANGVAATGATAAAGIFGTMALASLAAGALATKKNKK